MAIVFCSSSAREQYAYEHIASLALPAGSPRRFRYEKRYVDQDLLAKVEKEPRFLGNLEAYTAYLCADEASNLRVYPLRQVRVKSASIEGSSVIFLLELDGFVSRFGLDEKVVQDNASEIAKDFSIALPEGQRKFTGPLVRNFNKPSWMTLVPYDDLKRSHLPAFESCVDAISGSSHFREGKAIFVNYLGVHDPSSGGDLVRGKLRGNKSYRIWFYRYQSDKGAGDCWKRLALRTTSLSPSIEVLYPQLLEYRSRYDIDNIDLRIATSAKRDNSAPVKFDLISGTGDEEKVLSEFTIEYSVTADLVNRALVFAVSFVGLAATQLIVLNKLDKLDAITGGLVLLSTAVASSATLLKK